MWTFENDVMGKENAFPRSVSLFSTHIPREEHGMSLKKGVIMQNKKTFKKKRNNKTWIDEKHLFSISYADEDRCFFLSNKDKAVNQYDK